MRILLISVNRETNQYADMALGPCPLGRGDVQSRPSEQFIYSDPDIFGDPSEKERRNITAAVYRNCRASAILVLKLFMRSSLANFSKLQSFKQRDNFARAKDWNSAHAYGTITCWMPTNSASSRGSPSSRSISITSRRLRWSSSSVSP